MNENTAQSETQAETQAETRGIFYSSTTSPFARKVRIAMNLRGVAHHFDEIDYDPFQNGDDFLAANPIGQIPAFMTADGQGIFGSALMCAYLDTLGAEPAFASGPTVSFDALRRQAIADGVMECSVRFRAERGLRQPNERSEYWMSRWRNAILRGLTQLEETLPEEGSFDIGLVASACAALYLDLRHTDLGWRSGRPALAARVEELSEHPLFQQTDPSVTIPHQMRREPR
jgi:glutathione S-transferase